MMAPQVLARVVFVAAASVLWAGASAAPALAHGRSSDATNFDSRITSTPPIDGVTWEVHGGDEYLAVENPTATELHVLGYEGEPWLRVGPDGVFRNVRSAATYVNADRYAQVEVPEMVDPDADPEWERVSDGHSWYWHDHRTHWMAPTVPPAVRSAADEAQVVQDWEVPIRYDGSDLVVAGELWWVPAPPVVPWLAAGLVVSLPALWGLLRGRDASTRTLVRPAAAVLAFVAIVNVIHLADDLFAAPAPASAKAFAAVQTAMFIAVAVFGAVRGWQAGDGAFTALGVGAVAAFVGQGLLYLPALTSSQLQSVVPDAVGRFAIGLSLAQVLPVGLVAVIGTRRLLPDPASYAHEPIASAAHEQDDPVAPPDVASDAGHRGAP